MIVFLGISQGAISTSLDPIINLVQCIKEAAAPQCKFGPNLCYYCFLSTFIYIVFSSAWLFGEMNSCWTKNNNLVDWCLAGSDTLWLCQFIKMLDSSWEEKYSVAALCCVLLVTSLMSHWERAGKICQQELGICSMFAFLTTRNFNTQSHSLFPVVPLKERLVVLSRPVWAVGTFRRRIGNFHFLCSIMFPPSFWRQPAFHILTQLSDKVWNIKYNQHKSRVNKIKFSTNLIVDCWFVKHIIE